MAIQIPKRKRQISRGLLWKALVVIVCVGVVLGALELTHVTNFIHRQPAAASQSGPTPEQRKEEAAVDAQNKQTALDNPPSTNPTPTPTASSISLSAKKASNGTVTVFTNLGNVASGSCTLTVTNGDASTVQTAAVIYQPEYSICAGFSIPVTSVGSGNWTLTLKLDSNGTAVTKSIQLEVAG